MIIIIIIKLLDGGREAVHGCPQGHGVTGASLRPLPEALGVLGEVKGAVVAGQINHDDDDDDDDDDGDGDDDDDDDDDDDGGGAKGVKTRSWLW